MPKEVQTILDANNILTEKSKVVNTHYMQNSHDYSFDESGRQKTAAPVTRASQGSPRSDGATVLKMNITQLFPFVNKTKNLLIIAKIKDTAHRLNDVGRPKSKIEGYALESGVF